MKYLIDKMKDKDWNEVASIYLEGINTRMATFQRDIPTWEQWNSAHIVSCRLVATVGDKIAGWVALSPTSSRCVYAGVAEVSVYVGNEYRGMGIGRALLDKVIELSEKNGFWTLQSGIIKDNICSIELHRKCGFREIGYREKVGKMPDGTWHDVVLMERRSKTVGCD